MPLLPPTVGAPLSPCSFAVRIYGAFQGATIEIYAVEGDTVGTPIATGRASGPDYVIELPPGFSLPPRSVVKAVQTFEGESSLDPGANPDGVEVSFDPTREGVILPAPVWPFRLNEGGNCTVLHGLIPGTLVTIIDTSGAILAEGGAIDTTLRLGLNRSITASDVLTAKTQVCGRNGPESRYPFSVNSFMNTMLTPPIIKEPLIECATHIGIGDVYPGASVILNRRGREIGGCFDYPEQFFALDPLMPDEMVIARQGFPDSGMEFISSREAFVIPLEELDPPKVNGPLCAGTFRVVVEDLQPEAIVTVYNNETELGRAVAGSSTQTFIVPPLMEGVLTVKQDFCGRESLSEPVMVESAEVLHPVIDPLPYECSTIVRVSNVRPGARIRIADRFGLGYIGEATAYSNEVLVRVAGLTANEAYVVFQDVCGRQLYNPFTALPLDTLSALPKPKILRTLLPGDREVRVGKRDPDSRYMEDGEIYRGAIVDVYVNDVYRGSVESATGTVSVPIIGGVRETDRVKVLQRLCDRESEPSETIVPACRGRVRVGLKYVVGEGYSPDLIRTHRDKFLTEFDRMRDLYRFHGFEVEAVGEIQMLPIPELEMIRSTDHAQMSRLTSNRDGLNDTDIVVYQVPDILDVSAEGYDVEGFVRPPYVGAFVEHEAAALTVAHEVGHILLGSSDPSTDHSRAGADRGRLMYYGSASIDLDSTMSLRGALSEEELGLMATSRFFHPC